MRNMHENEIWSHVDIAVQENNFNQKSINLPIFDIIFRWYDAENDVRSQIMIAFIEKSKPRFTNEHFVRNETYQMLLIKMSGTKKKEASWSCLWVETVLRLAL